MEHLDNLVTDLTHVGYRPCFYLELHCGEHGDVRVGIESAPPNEYACPLCGAACSAMAMGRGITRRELPTFEVLCKPLYSVRVRNARKREAPQAGRRC